MKRWMLFLMAFLCLSTLAYAQQPPPPSAPRPPGEVPQLVAYDNEGH